MNDFTRKVWKQATGDYFVDATTARQIQRFAELMEQELRVDRWTKVTARDVKAGQTVRLVDNGTEVMFQVEDVDLVPFPILKDHAGRQWPIPDISVTEVWVTTPELPTKPGSVIRVFHVIGHPRWLDGKAAVKTPGGKWSIPELPHGQRYFNPADLTSWVMW